MRYEWNGGICPHTFFAETLSGRKCLDCGEEDHSPDSEWITAEWTTIKSLFEDEDEPNHKHGCICADCSDAELTADND